MRTSGQQRRGSLGRKSYYFEFDDSEGELHFYILQTIKPGKMARWKFLCEPDEWTETNGFLLKHARRDKVYRSISEAEVIRRSLAGIRCKNG